MSKTAKELWKLARASGRLKSNPGAEAAHDQLEKAVADKGLSVDAYLRGVRDIVDRFER